MKRTKTGFSANALRLSVSLALAAGLGTGSGAAFAQDQDAAATEGRVEVTGTRIRQIDLETAQPVHTITRADIDHQGFTSVGEILENITAMGAPPISRSSPLSSGTTVGGAFVNLRNLGASRTLVLLNGQRLGISTGGLADISVIPVVVVERIEILKDSASAIYGSDAIAGVINIITRTGYDGLRASVMYGEQSEGDQETERADFVMGFTGARGSLTTAFEYFKEGPVWFRDRPFSAFPNSHLSPDTGWTVVGGHGGMQTLGGRRVVRDGGDWRNVDDWIPQNFAPHTQGGHAWNFNEQMTLRSARDTKTIFVDGNYELTDDVRFRTTMMYTNRNDFSSIAGYPFQNGAGRFDSLSFVTHIMPTSSYFNPLGDHHGFATPTPIGALGFGEWWRRGWEVMRTQDRDMNAMRFSAGLDGGFEALGRFFEWDFNYMWNNNRVVSKGIGDFNTHNIGLAIGPSFLDPATGRVTCGTPDAPLPLHSGPGGCIPWNPWLHVGQEEEGGLTNNPELQEFLFQQTNDLSDNTTQVFNFNLTGPIVALPAGDMYFATGVEHRKESGSLTPDPLKVTGVSSTLATMPTVGSYSVAEVYGELLIPLLSAMPMAEELNLTVATRYSDYDTFGDTTNSSIGITWKPIDELMVRGTWGEGFRAPTISDLFFGGSQTFAFVTDPCDTVHNTAATDTAVRARCEAGVAGITGTPPNFAQPMQGFTPCPSMPCQTPVPFVSGSNPNTLPEESEAYTIGVVWNPEWLLPGLTVLVDYWRIRIDNTIVGDSPTQILNDCYVDNITARCAGFTRAPAGHVATMTFGGRNAGFVDTKGIDFDIAYRFTTDQYGAFSITANNTYTYDTRFRSTDDADVMPSHSVGFGSNFRFRSNINVGWNFGDFGVSWTSRYHSSMREACSAFAGGVDVWCSHPEFVREWRLGGNPNPVNKVGSTTFHDLQVRWTAPWNALVTVGANNVFDKHGPVMFSQPSSNTAYYGGFDIGRFWYVRYQQDF